MNEKTRWNILRDWNQEAWASLYGTSRTTFPPSILIIDVLVLAVAFFPWENKVTGRGCQSLDIKVGHWKEEKTSRANNPKGKRRN
jgi:hypothetical protein